MIEIIKSYKSIFKETSLFGGVQVILIGASIIRNMLIAKWLGVEAVGLLGILQTTIAFFITTISFGFPTLLVRSYSEDEQQQNENEPLILKKGMLLLGIIGTLLFFCLLPFYGEKIFGDVKYGWILEIGALLVLFKQITSMNTSEVQGKQKLNDLAKINIYASVIGLLFTIPMYYFFDLAGAVWALVIASFVEMVVSLSINRFHFKELKIKWKISDYIPYLKKGFSLNYGNILTLLAQYIVIVYITNFGGLEKIGFYNAGFAIINNYVALLFVAMSTGYLPRIVKLLNYQEDLQTEITKQLNFSLLSIGILAMLCIVFAKLIVTILYSADFDIVIPFLQIAVFGMIFKAFSWCLGYLIIAKVDSKVLMFTGIIFNVLFVLFLLAGFHFNGLIGVAYAFVGYNLLHLLSIALIVRFRYKITLAKKTMLFLIGILLVNGTLLYFLN